MSCNLSGDYNFAAGCQAAYYNTGGCYNTAIGYNSLHFNDTGCYNAAIGCYALFCNTTGDYNNAIGGGALYYNTTGGCNFASGRAALYNNTEGHHNIAIGEVALCCNTTNSNNIAFGLETLRCAQADFNIAFGCGNLKSTTGSCNTAFGRAALLSNSTGAHNTAIGAFSLYGNTTGSNNTAIGCYAQYGSLSGTDNFAAGNSALCNNWGGCCNIAIGCLTLRNNSTGSNNIGLGYAALNTNTTGGGNIALGQQALVGNTTGSNNFAAGCRASCSNTTGNYNTAIGNSALRVNTTGIYNTAIGYGALENTTSSSNVGIGPFAGVTNTSGTCNIAIGYAALQYNSTGSYNVALGRLALRDTSGGNNIGLGCNALLSNTTGVGNIGIGSNTLSQKTAGNHNISIGTSAGVCDSAGSNVTTAGNSIAIGCDTKFGTTTPTNEIVIGSGAIGNGDNTTTIGNSSTTDAYICGTLNVSSLSAASDIYVNTIKSSTYPTYNIISLEDDNLPNQNGVSLQSVGSMAFFIDVNNNSSNDSFDWCVDDASGGSPTNIMRLTDEGYLGIGTTSPSQELHVKGEVRAEDGGSSAYVDLKASQLYASGAYDVIVGSNNPLHFRTSDTRRMTIDGSGNVGIGTSSPSKTLHVAGDSLVTGDSTIYGNLSVTGDFTCIETTVSTTSALSVTNTGTGPALYVCQAGVQPIAHFIDANGDDIIFDDDGKVGLGTSSPSSKLHIADSGNDVKLTLDRTDARTYSIYTNSACDFKIRDEDAGTDRITILSGGNVGIGTTAPSFTLDVETADEVVASFASTDNKAAIQIADNDTSVYVSAENSRASFGFGIGISNNNLNILSDGKVGIGNCSPGEQLTVTGNVSASGNGYFACVIAGGYFEEKAASPELADYPTGSVVVLDSTGGLKLSDTENDKNVFGITQCGAQQPIILGAEPVLVTGDVCVGDFIVTSNVPGHGMSSCCTQHGTVIAQAMERGSGCSYLIKAMIRKM